MIKYLKDEDFKEMTKSGKYLVDFYAEWCGPCKMLGPVLEQIESIDIIKVNTDEHPELARKYQVMSIPTLVYLKDGVVVKKEIGFRSKEMLEKSIEQL